MTETDPAAVSGAYFDMNDEGLIDIPDGYHWDENKTIDDFQNVMKLVADAPGA